LLYPSPAAGRNWRTMVLATLISGGLLAGFFFPYYGKERMNYFSKNEVAAAEYLYNVAPAGSALVDAVANYPWAFKNYEHFTYLSLVFDDTSGREISPKQRKALLSNPAAYISRVLEGVPHTAAYLIITRSQEATSDENGYLPVGSLSRIEHALKQSGRFKVLVSNPDATVFILAVPQ
ncbi:MAG: hypothetical protein ACRDG4_21445, partial [Chloroflexota bacterium]